MKPTEAKKRTCRSTPAQLANLRRREPKTGVTRDASFSVRVSKGAREIVKGHIEAEGITISDFFEFLSKRLERGDITIGDILKN